MAARPPVSAAILCGGSGRRMGGVDKGQLVYGGQTFVERLIDTLRLLTSHIMLIDRDASHPAPAGVHVQQDLVPNAGALGGVYTALATTPAERVLVVACDMPFLTPVFLEHLIAADTGADVVIPRDAAGRYPLCAVFQRTAAAAVKARIDAGRLRFEDMLATLDVRTVSGMELAGFDADGRLLLNVNTPEEYRQAVSGDHRGTTLA